MVKDLSLEGKKEASILLDKGFTSKEVAKKVGASVQQVAAIKAWKKMRREGIVGGRKPNGKKSINGNSMGLKATLLGMNKKLDKLLEILQ